MDPGSGSKRRKLDHSSFALKQAALIDFESRDAARMSTASIFTLQTDELLKGARVDYAKVLDGVDSLLHRLKGVIDSIPPHEAVPIYETSRAFEKKHRIAIPYPEPRPHEESPYLVAYDRPAQCNVVGSYVSRTMVRSQPSLAVDMVVQMPRGLFQDKDYQDLRYFHRRAYYLAYIASHVRPALGQELDLEYQLLHDNLLLPILVLKTRPATTDDNTNDDDKKKKKKKKSKTPTSYSVRIIPCAPEDLFPASKLTPTSVNLNRDSATKAPTPFYNATLKAESTFITYLRLLAKARADCPSFADACILGRTWLQQRGLGSPQSQGGFGHFEWAALTVLLLQSGGRNGKPVLSGSLSSTELFKAVVHYLADTDVAKKPVILGSGATVNRASVAEANGYPVVYDAATSVNLLHRMTPWSAALLRTHARTTADLLADETSDKFAPIFIMRADVWSQLYDAVLEIDSVDVLLAPPGSDDTRGGAYEYAASAYKILRRAYGDRASLINIRVPSSEAWHLQSRPGGLEPRLAIGVVFDAHHMPRQMEHGPPAEEAREAARFRQFWGDRSELRRFKDGSILECVEWQAKGAPAVAEEIARHALGRHLKLAPDEVVMLADAAGPVIGASHLDKAAFDGVRQALQRFEADVRALDDLPLQIRQMAGVSSAARYASVRAPLPGVVDEAGVAPPLEVNMYFEVSSRWPDNLVAIQETKIELLLDLDRRLGATNDAIVTYLGREDRPASSEANLAYLDVLYADTGAAFRVRIWSDAEGALLERRAANRTLEGYVRDAVADQLAEYRWHHSTAPLHAQNMATFATRLPALSPAVRLAKAWFAAHKLTPHVPDEVVELLVLSVFLAPAPWPVPSSGTSAFLRVLDLLARWDWRDEPLYINTQTVDDDDDNSSDSAKPADRRAALRRDLEAWRRRDPNMNNHAALFIATPHRPDGQSYTRTGPSRLVASRVTLLARAASALIKERDYRLETDELFTPSLADYDVLLHLSPKAVRGAIKASGGGGGGSKSKSVVYKNLAGGVPSNAQVGLPLRAHPVSVLLDRLRAVYDDNLIFFHGRFDDAPVDMEDLVVAAIWNPKMRAQKFRPGLGYNFTSVADAEKDLVEINKKAVLLEVARIAGDFIDEIQEVDEE